MNFDFSTTSVDIINLILKVIEIQLHNAVYWGQSKALKRFFFFFF